VSFSASWGTCIGAPPPQVSLEEAGLALRIIPALGESCRLDALKQVLGPGDWQFQETETAEPPQRAGLSSCRNDFFTGRG